jgi:hypothetical protein
VEEIQSGKVEMIPGEQVLRELAEEFPYESHGISGLSSCDI